MRKRQDQKNLLNLYSGCWYRILGRKWASTKKSIRHACSSRASTYWNSVKWYGSRKILQSLWQRAMTWRLHRRRYRRNGWNGKLKTVSMLEPAVYIRLMHRINPSSPAKALKPCSRMMSKRVSWL